jgi:hypothetical protein
VPRPIVVKEYFESANAVDVHNHYRQGALALEEAWQTQQWWHRLFATLLGMIVTDSYLAYSYFHPSLQERGKSFQDFCERLTMQLLTYSTEAQQQGIASRLRPTVSASTTP